MTDEKKGVDTFIPFEPLESVPASVVAVLTALREGIQRKNETHLHVPRGGSVGDEDQKTKRHKIAGAIQICLETFLGVMGGRSKEAALGEVFRWVGKAWALLYALKRKKADGVLWSEKDLADMDPGDPPLLLLSSLIFGSLRSATDHELLSIALDLQMASGSSVVLDPVLARRLSKIAGPWTWDKEILWSYKRSLPNGKHVSVWADGRWMDPDGDLKTFELEGIPKNAWTTRMMSHVDAFLIQEGYLLLGGVPQEETKASEDSSGVTAEPRASGPLIRAHLRHQWENATNVCHRCTTVRIPQSSYRNRIRYEYLRLYVEGSPPVFRVRREATAGGCYVHEGQVPFPPDGPRLRFLGVQRASPHSSSMWYLYTFDHDRPSTDGVPVVDWLARLGVLERETYRERSSGALWEVTLYLTMAFPWG